MGGSRVRPTELTAREVLRLQDAYERGWTVDALAVRYGISRRAVYRYANYRMQRLCVGTWCTHVRMTDEGPRFVGGWVWTGRGEPHQ